MNSVEEIKKNSFQFLHRLYKLSGCDEMVLSYTLDISKELGFDADLTKNITNYLYSKELIELISFGNVVRITDIGILKVLETLSNPDKPTEYFPPFNIIYDTKMMNSQIQQDSSQNTQIIMNENWFKKIVLSSIPLKQIDDQGMPINSASGCIISHCNKKLLLTVQHATGNMGDWVIECKYVPGKGINGYRVGAMMFLKEGNIITDKWRDIDFAYVIIPDNVHPYYQEVSYIDKKIKAEIPRLINTVNFDIEPDKNHKYGFHGQTRVSRDDEQQYVYAQPTIELDMQYVGAEDDMYNFKLNRRHPGHEYYYGCSGAPIVDSDGNIVALVVCGDMKESIIYGISLKKYKIVLDIECGIIK